MLASIVGADTAAVNPCAPSPSAATTITVTRSPLRQAHAADGCRIGAVGLASGVCDGRMSPSARRSAVRDASSHSRRTLAVCGAPASIAICWRRFWLPSRTGDALAWRSSAKPPAKCRVRRNWAHLAPPRVGRWSTRPQTLEVAHRCSCCEAASGRGSAPTATRAAAATRPRRSRDRGGLSLPRARLPGAVVSARLIRPIWTRGTSRARSVSRRRACSPMRRSRPGSGRPRAWC